MRLESLALTGLPRAALTTPFGAKNTGRAFELSGSAVVLVGKFGGVPFKAGSGRTSGKGASSAPAFGAASSATPRPMPATQTSAIQNFHFISLQRLSRASPPFKV